MKKNEGPIDRVIRIILGAIIGGLAYIYLSGEIIGLIGYLIAAILIITGITGFCPMYYILETSNK